MIENIETFVLGNPVIVALLTIIMILGYHWQKGLTYQEFMAVHTAKSIVFQALDSYFRSKGRPLVKIVPYQDPDFVCSVDKSPKQVANKLLANGYSAHLISMLKIRQTGDKQQVCHSQWSKQTANSNQIEVYLFVSGDATEVYAHREGSILNPRKHLESKQKDGSAMVRELFNE
jgi:hypothetical protein